MPNLTRFLCTCLVWLAASLNLFAAPVPLTGNSPVPVEKLRVDNPAVLPMTGTWKFQLTHGINYDDGIFCVSPVVADASSYQGEGNKPANAADGIKGTRWMAKDAKFPQWWQLDMGRIYQVKGLNLVFEEGGPFKYQFKIEASTDNKNWTQLAETTATNEGPVKIPPADCRYLRITFSDARDEKDQPHAACIREAWITILKDGKEVRWHPESDAAQLAEANKFKDNNYNDNNWKNIPVPANWEMEGFSKPTYNQPDDAVGLYRRWVDVPSGFAGQRVFWHFDGVFDGAEIFVNGSKVGYHESGFTAFDVDVTAALKPGQKNLFALRVCKNTFSVDLDTGDFWSLGGIYRENYLAAVPQLHVSDVKILTKLDDKYVDATLDSTVSVTGKPGQKFTISAKLYTWERGDTGLPEMKQSGEVGSDGQATIDLSQPVKAPKLWSAEHPNLYYLVVSVAENGKETEHVQERFGFHQIEMRDGVVYWNGQKIKLTGVCRHEEWAALGHAINEDAWQKDVALIKDANVNAVRTSHYNHAKRFIEICEEKGLYLIDEVPGCWCDPSDPAYKDAWLQRTRETFARDKNSPAVVIWSIGNESGSGPSNIAATELMKQLDPTRLAIISCRGPGATKKVDFEDMHYPSIDMLNHYAEKKWPFIITEGPHIFCIPAALVYDYGVKDYWGRALNNQWDTLWNTDTAFGAFIWEWQDQGLADKFPEKEKLGSEVSALAGTEADMGATGANSEAVQPGEAALRGNNYKGIVDGYRNPKPEYWNVKMVYSPVVVDVKKITVSGGQYVIPLKNRYSFTDLSELTCEWQALSGDKVLSGGKAKLACAPLSTGEGKIPAVSGAKILYLKFIHPDGRSVYSTHLQTPEFTPTQPPASLASTGAVRSEDANSKLLIHTANTVISVDKQSGLISWQADGQEIVSSGLALNLGQGRIYHNEFSRFKKGEPEIFPPVQSKRAPLLKNVSVTATPNKDNALTVIISGNVYLVESNDLQAQLVNTLTISPDAKIKSSWQLNWKAANRNAFELGITLTTPTALDTLTWSRDNLWTDYPAGHIGELEGTVKSDSVSFRCSKRDLDWALLSGKQPLALTVRNCGSPLHLRGKADANGNTLFLSSAIAPPRDFSTNLVFGDTIYLRTGQTLSGSFEIAVTRR